MGCSSCVAGRHQLSRVPLPANAARRCDFCRTRHPVFNGECWVETRRRVAGVYTELVGYTCVDGEVYDATSLMACEGLLAALKRAKVEGNPHVNPFRVVKGEGGRNGKGKKERRRR
jgi:Cleavage inducing molecular chaperone